jgi:hypothetical protein
MRGIAIPEGNDKIFQKKKIIYYYYFFSLKLKKKKCKKKKQMGDRPPQKALGWPRHPQRASPIHRRGPPRVERPPLGPSGVAKTTS